MQASKLILLLFLLPIFSLSSESPALWQTIIGGEQNTGMVGKDCPEELPGGMVILKDGGIVIIGASNDCSRMDTSKLAEQRKYSSAWAAKIGPDGNPIWWKYLFAEKPIDLGGYTQSVLSYESVAARFSKASSDGGFVTIGSIGSVEKKQILFKKYNAKGEPEWEKTHLSGAFCDSFCGATDASVYHLHELSNGKWSGVVSVNYRAEKTEKKDNITSVSSSIETAYFLVRFSKDGDIKFSKHLEGIVNFPNTSLGFADGGILLAEHSNITSGQEAQKDVVLHRYDEDGKPIWKKKFGKPNQEDLASRLLFLSDENILFAGASGSGRNLSVWLMKLSPNGETVWENTDKIEGMGFLTDIVETPEKNFMSLAADGEGPLRLVKFSAEGKKLWEKKHTKRLYLSYQIYNTSDGFLIDAYTKGKPAIYTDALLIRTDKEGNLSKDALRKNFPN